MLAHIQLLPNRDEKGIEEFFDLLNGDKNKQSTSLMDQEVKTDFEAIKRAKEKIARMT